VVFPASDGQYGVMGGRTPLVVMLGSGLLRVEPTAGAEREFWLEGGFATMRENTLTVLADECQSIDEMDRDDAWDAIEKARAMPSATDEEFALRCEALDLARKRFAFLQTHRKQMHKAGGSDGIMTLV